MEAVQAQLRAAGYQQSRRELTAYATRLVMRPDVAEELVQEAALRLVASERSPTEGPEVRAWLFRAVTRLAIDHLRRHSTWREKILLETREEAGRNKAFVAESRLLRGSPELQTIARDHLAVCFSCVLRNLAAEKAAALLLVEVYGFEVAEAAEWLEATFGQTKNRIQAAREEMREKYAATCALVAKEGVCNQCVELGAFFNGRGQDPLEGTSRDIDARLAVLRERKEQQIGTWHRMMMRLVDEVLGR